MHFQRFLQRFLLKVPVVEKQVKMVLLWRPVKEPIPVRTFSRCRSHSPMKCFIDGRPNQEIRNTTLFITKQQILLSCNTGIVWQSVQLPAALCNQRDSPRQNKLLDRDPFTSCHSENSEWLQTCRRTFKKSFHSSDVSWERLMFIFHPSVVSIIHPGLTAATHTARTFSLQLPCWSNCDSEHVWKLTVIKVS